MEPVDLSNSLKNIEKNIFLSQTFKKDEIIKQTALQIIKDFQEFGIEIVFSGEYNKAYQELLDQLIPNIELLLKNDFHQFFNLLYRIDLSENLILESEVLYPEMEKQEIISHLIIQRELKKVLVRNYYKEKGEF